MVLEIPDNSTLDSHEHGSDVTETYKYFALRISSQVVGNSHRQEIKKQYDSGVRLIRDFYSRYLHSARRHRGRNIQAIQKNEIKFEVVEFRFIDSSFKHDLRWEWWSRIFEYELILTKLQDLGCTNQAQIHNSCWGFQGCHVEFKNELESRYTNVLSSDVRPSTFLNTAVYDATTPCPQIWKGVFDFVLNVSTIEEIPHPHIEVFFNLLQMVKMNGYLIVTFDFPGIQLDMFETLFKKKIDLDGDAVTGMSSPVIQENCRDLRVGYFVVQRLK